MYIIGVVFGQFQLPEIAPPLHKLSQLDCHYRLLLVQKHH